MGEKKMGEKKMGKKMGGGWEGYRPQHIFLNLVN